MKQSFYTILCILLSTSSVLAEDFEVGAQITFTQSIAVDLAEVENSSLPQSMEIKKTNETIKIIIQ